MKDFRIKVRYEPYRLPGFKAALMRFATKVLRRFGVNVTYGYRFRKSRNVGMYVLLPERNEASRNQRYRYANTIYIEASKRWKPLNVKWITEAVGHESVHSILNHRLGEHEAALMLDNLPDKLWTIYC